MKKLLSIILSCLLVLSLASFTGCFDGNTPNKDDDEEKTASVNVDINPSIELIVDKDGKVTAVRGVNDDGVLLVYGEEGIVGEDLEKAIEKVTSLAIEYGYLNEFNSVVGTIVNATDEEFKKSVTEKVDAVVTATAEKSGLTVKTDANGAFSLLRQMEEFKQAHPDNELIQSVTVEKFRLALSVSETGEISLEAAVELNDEKLLKMLSEADEKIEAYATEEFNLRKAQALALYDKVVAIKTYAAYTEVYASRLTDVAVDKLDKLTTAYYGGAYQLYASAKTGFGAISSAYDVVREVKNYPLSDEQIRVIASAFGIEDVTPLRDENGNITLKSVEAYADKYFKNATGEKLEEVKTAVANALTEIEEVVTSEVAKISASCKEAINAQIAQAELVYTTVKPILESVKTMLSGTFASFIPGAEEIVADVNEIISDYEDISARVKGLLESEDATVSDFTELVEEYGDKANSYLEKIKNDLTEEEKAVLENKIAEIEKSCKTEKEALEQTIDEIATSVKSAIETAKKSLKTEKE